MLDFSKALATDITPEVIKAIFGDSEKSFEWAWKSLENIIAVSSDMLRQIEKDGLSDEINNNCLINLNYYDSSVKDLLLDGISNNNLKRATLIRRLLKVSYCFKNINLIELFDCDLVFETLGLQLNNVEAEMYCFKLLLIIQCCHPQLLQTCSRIEFLAKQKGLVEFFNSNIKLDFNKNEQLYHYFIEYFLNLYYLTSFQDDKLFISHNMITLSLSRKIKDHKFKDYLVLKILIKVGDNFQDEDFKHFIAPIFENTISYFLSLPIYYASNSSYVNKEEQLKLQSRRIFHISIAEDVDKMIRNEDVDLSKYDIFIASINCCDIDLLISIYSNLTRILYLSTRQQVIIFYNKILKLLESFFGKLNSKSKLPKHQQLMLKSYQLPGIEKFVFGVMSALSVSNEKLFDITELIVETLLQDTLFYESNISHILNWIESVPSLNFFKLSVQTFNRLMTNLNDCLEIIIDKKLPKKLNTVQLLNALVSINTMILNFDQCFYSKFVDNISFNKDVVEMVNIASGTIAKLIKEISPAGELTLNDYKITKVKPEKIKDKELTDTMRYIKYILDIVNT